MAHSEAFALIGGAVVADAGVELPPYAFAWVRLAAPGRAGIEDRA
jgi:hypothetical protein